MKDADVVSPYPKRGPRKNYKEDEVPDDDHYLCKFLILFSAMLVFLDPRQSRKGPMNSALSVRP